MLLGDRLVAKDHRSSPTATHKEDNQQINPAPTSSHNGSPYVHATGITNFNTSISQIHNYSTRITLISPSSYLKIIIRNQTSHSIQCTLYESLSLLDAHHIRTKFITKANYHVVLKDSQNNISEAWEFIYFFKIKPPSCSKRYKWSTRANNKLLQKI